MSGPAPGSTSSSSCACPSRPVGSGTSSRRPSVCSPVVPGAVPLVVSVPSPGKGLGVVLSYCAGTEWVPGPAPAGTRLSMHGWGPAQERVPS